jgi:hypothetical protein
MQQRSLGSTPNAEIEGLARHSTPSSRSRSFHQHVMRVLGTTGSVYGPLELTGPTPSDDASACVCVPPVKRLAPSGDDTVIPVPRPNAPIQVCDPDAVLSLKVRRRW